MLEKEEGFCLACFGNNLSVVGDKLATEMTSVVACTVYR